MRAGEITVAAVAARADPGARDLERTGEGRQRVGVELDPDTAPLGELVGVAEQPEPGDVGDRARRERP